MQQNNLPIKLGLIAGNGKFPILLSMAAREQKISIVAAAVWGDTSFLLRFVVDKIRWFKVGQLKDLFDYFKENGIKQAVMAGQVNPNHLFDQQLALDEEFSSLFAALRDRRADTIFEAVAQRLKARGIELVDSTVLLREYMAPKGTLTKRGPSLLELDDIAFGKEIAKQMGGLDVGQTVVIKDKAIVAIEAMEGTDRTILRGGAIARQGAVIVKMSKPKQDDRFDVPVIGPKTIRTMAKCKARCLAIEAQKTIVIDRNQCVSLANQYDICIVGI